MRRKPIILSKQLTNRRRYCLRRDMKHPRVVQLFDVFEIDGTAFATVLEYCKGIDLDEK